MEGNFAKKGFVNSIRKYAAKKSAEGKTVLKESSVLGAVRQRQRDKTITKTQIKMAIHWMKERGEIVRTKVDGESAIEIVAQ